MMGIHRLVGALLIVMAVVAAGCKRKAEEAPPGRPVRPAVEGVEVKVAEHLAQGRLCRRVYGTALAVGRPMCSEMAKALPKAPALLGYYTAMMDLEAGDVEAARKGFAALADAAEMPADIRERARIWALAGERPQPRRPAPGANGAGAQALNLNEATILLAQAKADEAKKALDAVNPQLPIDECDVEKVKLPGRELQRTIRFYDPALLKCWADYHFLKAVELGEGAASARVRLDVAAALGYLGRNEKAEKHVKTVLEMPSLSSQDRLAALALRGEVLWARGDKTAARKTWDGMGTASEDAVVLLLQAHGDVPGLPADVLEAGLAKGQEMLKGLRQKESEYSERRFRERHRDLFWAAGWLSCAAGMQRASQGDLARAAEHLTNAEEIGNRLYEESSRFDLKKNPPLFLAELADVYLLKVLALDQGNAYLEDMLRYMYDESMLPKVLPAAWQVREYAKMLYALRDLSNHAEATGHRREPMPSPPSLYRSLMASAQPPVPTAGGSSGPVWWAVCLVGTALLTATVIAVLFIRRHRRMKEFSGDCTD